MKRIAARLLDDRLGHVAQVTGMQRVLIGVHVRILLSECLRNGQNAVGKKLRSYLYRVGGQTQVQAQPCPLAGERHVRRPAGINRSFC